MSDSVSQSLISAVREGNLERVREMIDALVLSYAKDWSEGYILLCHAVMTNNTEIIKLLLMRGSKVNSKGCRNTMPSDTPLHFAIKNDDIEIVKMILDKDADIEAKNEIGRTPLHNAIYYRKLEFTELLLNRGANVVATDNNLCTPLHIALEIGHVSDSGSIQRNYPQVCISIQNTMVVIIKMLLSKGANVNAKNIKEETPLSIASTTGNKEVVEILLQWGAKIDSKDLHNSPLHIAAEKGYTDIVKILLNFGADVDSGYGYFKTPLYIAIKSGHLQVVKALLEHGSDINARYKHYTPFGYAMHHLDLYWSHKNFEFFEDHNINCVWEKIINILTKHIIKLNIAKLNKNHIVLFYSNNIFKTKCEEEIERIKSEKIIVNKDISFHDILTKSINTLAVYAKNENIVQVLRGDNKTKFPLYGGIINSNIRKGIKRKELLEECNEIFLPSFTSISGLPYDCIEKIYTYLDDKDIQILIDASNPRDVSNPYINDMEITSEM